MGWAGSEPRPEDLGLWQMQEGRIFQKEGTALEGMNSRLGFVVNGAREKLRGWCLGFEAHRLGEARMEVPSNQVGADCGEGGLDFIPSATGQRWREGQRQNHAWLSGSLAAEWRADWGGHAGRRGHTRPGESGRGREEGREAGDGAEEELGGPRGAGHARGSRAGSCVCVRIPPLLRT